MEPWGSSVKQDSNMLLQHVHVLCMFIFPGTVSYNPRVWAGSVAWRGTEEGSGQSLLQHVPCYLVNHELDSPVYESSDKTGYVRGLINSNRKPAPFHILLIKAEFAVIVVGNVENLGVWKGIDELGLDTPDTGYK